MKNRAAGAIFLVQSAARRSENAKKRRLRAAGAKKIAKISPKSRFFIRFILDLLRFRFLNNYPPLVLGDLEQGGIVIWNRSDSFAKQGRASSP